MVWNHPKETSICISYGRMFQLCTSLLTPGAVGVRKLGEEQQSEEDGRQSQFGKQAGAFYIAWDLNFHPFRNSLTLWITFGQPPPDPFRAFLLGGGEVWMERGNTERDVNECATVLPMCPFLNIYIYIVDFHGYSCLTSTISHSAKRCNIWKVMIKGDVWYHSVSKSTQAQTLGGPPGTPPNRKERTQTKQDQMGTGEWSFLRQWFWCCRQPRLS